MPSPGPSSVLTRPSQDACFTRCAWRNTMPVKSDCGALCQPFAQTQAVPHTVCGRMKRFLPEMFVCVPFAFRACPQLSCWTQRAHAGPCPDNQRRLAQSTTLRHSHGSGLSLWHRDGSRSSSFPSVRGSPHPLTLLGSRLNATSPGSSLPPGPFHKPALGGLLREHQHLVTTHAETDGRRQLPHLSS